MPSTKEESRDIATLVKGIISDVTGFPKDLLGAEQSLADDFGIDSIKHMEILSKMEQEFSFGEKALDSDEIYEIKTIGALIAFVEELVQPAPKNGTSPSRLTMIPYPSPLKRLRPRSLSHKSNSVKMRSERGSSR